MNNKALVSIVLVAFNEASKTIEKAIDSVTRQTLADIEIVVVDASTALKTIKTIDKKVANDYRIKVIRPSSKTNFSQALNIGLKAARGKFIARMDPDDISHPSRLRLQVDFLNKNPAYSVVGSSVKIINFADEEISYRRYPTSSFGLRVWTIFRNPLAHPTVMMRREIIDQGFLYDESFTKAEDLELWLRLIKSNYKIANLEQALLKYRVTGNFSDKRVGENFRANFLARRKNFCWKRPISGVISLICVIFYRIAPRKVIDSAYKIIR